MTSFDGVDPEQARQFAARWLPAWTGNDPDWTWTQTASAPLPGGFLNYWLAQIPTPNQTLEITGVCTVRLRDDLIERTKSSSTARHCSRRYLTRGIRTRPKHKPPAVEGSTRPSWRRWS